MPDSGTVYRFVPRAIATSVSAAVNNDAIRIVPNPATDKVTVYLPTEEKTTIVMLNSLGSAVYQKEVSGMHSIDINTRELPAGQYFIRMSGNWGDDVKALSVMR